MGTIELSPESWVCKHCGSSVVREHPQEQCYLTGESPDISGRWTTHAERLANPDLKKCRIQHCMYMPDGAWMSCDKCGVDLDEAGLNAANFWMSKIDWSKVTIHEHVGMGVVNDFAVARVKVGYENQSPVGMSDCIGVSQAGKAMSEEDYKRLKGKTVYVLGEPEFVGKFPMRIELTVLPADEPRNKQISKRYQKGDIS